MASCNNTISSNHNHNNNNNIAHSQNNPHHLLAFDAPTLVIQAFQSGGDTLQQVGAFAAEVTHYVELFQQQQQQQQRGSSAAVGHLPTPTNDSAAASSSNTMEGCNVTPKQPILPQKRRVSDFKADHNKDERNVTPASATQANLEDDDTETEDDADDDHDNDKSEKPGRPCGPSWYKGKSLKETHLQYSVGHSRKILDLYWSELGLTAPFGNNAVIAMKGATVSHLSLKNTYSTLPYQTTYPLKYNVGANTPGRKNAVFLQTKTNPARALPLASSKKTPSPAPTVPVFWSPWATKDGTKYYYIGHYRCVTERDDDDNNSCLEFDFEHYDTVLEAKLAHIDPDYVKKEEPLLLSPDY